MFQASGGKFASAKASLCELCTEQLWRTLRLFVANQPMTVEPAALTPIPALPEFPDDSGDQPLFSEGDRVIPAGRNDPRMPDWTGGDHLGPEPATVKSARRWEGSKGMEDIADLWVYHLRTATGAVTTPQTAYQIIRLTDQPEELPDPTPSAPTGTADSLPELLPPLKAWGTQSYCKLWTETAAEHGPLMAIAIKSGNCWVELYETIRTVCGAQQKLPAEERDLWISLVDGYSVTKRAHLPHVLDAMRTADAVARLTVRAVPDGTHCTHARCQRRHSGPAA
ncbi:hypothetical protein [Nocardia fluminea]|uniref:hypothetical protein n=1 Tax=Nocardia fluminea TaxID=134984 RepID=UPI0036529CEF